MNPPKGDTPLNRAHYAHARGRQARFYMGDFLNHRLTRAALSAALTVAVTVALGAGRVMAEEPAAAVVSLLPVSADSSPVTGPFTASAEVTMNASSTVRVEPRLFLLDWSRFLLLPAKTVTAAECPQTCTLSWAVDPTSRDLAWPTTDFSVRASATTDANPSTSLPSTEARFISPIADFTASLDFERPASTVTADYQGSVLDTGGTLLLSSSAPRSPGESLHAIIRERNGLGAQVGSAVGSWGAADPATGVSTGRVPLDTATLAEGGYTVYVQGRTADGQWGPPRWSAALDVRHHPVAEWGPTDPIVTGSAATLTVDVRSLAASGWSPSSVEVAVDGRTPVVMPATFDGPQDGPWHATVKVPAEQLPVGTRTLSARVLDQVGQPIGSVGALTVPVLAFSEALTVAPLVVGQQVPVTVKGTAPGGLTYSSCDFAFYDALGLNNTVARTVCANGQTSFATTTAVTPRVAGLARFELRPKTTTGLSTLRAFPVTVYAARSATVTAPTSSSYGSRLSATVRVMDRSDVTKAAVGKPGVAVTLQRKAAGSTTWVSLATVKTDAYGKAVIPFTNTANGRLRAVATSSVPGRTIVTGERSVTSVSTVSWSSLPTSAYSGSLVYAKVYAKPYEKGAYVRVQARLKGTSTWRTLGTASVSSTGYAKPAMRLYTRGTWEVRVFRVATTLRTTGYSTVRYVSVR